MIVNTENGINVGNGNGSKWSTEEMMMLYHLKVAKKTHREITEIMTSKLGRREYSENLIHKKWQQTDWVKFLEEQGEKEAALAEITEIEAEKQKIIETTLGNQDRLVKREHARTEVIIDALKSSILRLPKPKSSDSKYTPCKHKYRAEHMGVILSDIHMGASYTKEDTGGLSEFNIDIVLKRLNVLKTTLLSIAERHRHVCDLPELHVFSLGDVVAGMRDAGAWSSNYIDLDIYDQMIAGAAALRDVMATWAKAFKKVHFYGIFGNHGRIGKKGAQKDYTNWDRICYEFLRVSMQEYDNVEWEIPKAWWLQKKILNHNFYMTHGDGIRGSMGVPYYGVERAERLILGLMKEKPDYMLLGHFHSPAELATNSGRIIMNGSFMGGDMYSLKDLRRKDRSEQKLFGIHEEKGVTWSYNIQLDRGE